MVDVNQCDGHRAPFELLDLGVVIAVRRDGDAGPQYTLDLAGEENTYDDEPATDDWQLFLEYLIDNAAPPVGA
ncbi:hypothetical protein [Glaciibacter sp. 2TAF33]|uniref:hypothetical protein n=1 Tax=Glaciibacter sp. 2TAF33 TaxID=3233015 RepID=UPI003F921E2B